MHIKRKQFDNRTRVQTIFKETDFICNNGKKNWKKQLPS